MRTFRFAEGTRVRIQRGAYPMDPSAVGREGLIVETSEARVGRYGVQIDGEDRLRDFAEDEVVPMAD